MYRLLFLAWLFFCLALTVEGAPLYVTGQLKPWTTATPDFARTGASADTGANYYGPLDFFSRPTLTGSPTSVATSPATFPSWYGVFSDQPSVRPYTITFQENAGVYKFERTNFYPSLDNANNNYRWTYHFRIQTSSSVTGLFVTSTDEVAVYNNGILLAQNSGYSSTPRTTPTQSTAGASVLDFFTAHRSQDVTPQLTIQFSFSGAATCNAFSESQLTPFDVFTPSRIQTIGTGRVTGTAAAPVVEVMQAASKSAIGGVYPDVKFRVSNGFSTYFKFQYTGGQTVGSEGFAFVVQGYGLSTLAAQGGGEKLGYNFPNNLAVEFDTKQSTPTTGYGTIQTFDADGNHVEIHSSFSSASPASPTTPDSACAQCNSVINSLGTTNGAKPLPILTSGTLEVYIEYVPGTMTIWVDPSLSTQSYGFRSSSWVRRAPVTHSDFTNLFGSNPNQALAYMGFTSASNSVNSTNIQISEWKVWTVPVSATTTTQTPVYNPGWVADIARDRKAPTGANLKLQLVDGCGLPVNTPYDSVVATLVGPGNPMTEVNQNADGTWNVYYYNTLVGQNTLQLKVNEQTIIANGTTFSDVYNYVFIYPAPISTNNSYFVPDRVALAARTWRATDLLDVQVYARDAFNNANPMPGGNFRIFFSQQAQIAPSSQTGNMYNFTIGTNLAAPNIKIAVWYNGADILGSPTDAFEVLSGIYPDPVNTARTLTSDITTYKTVQYYGLIQAVAGQTGSFTVQFRDQYDNVIKEPALVVPGNVSLSIGCISSGVVDSRCNPNPATVNAVQIGGPLLRITYGSQVASQYQINITLAKTSAAGNPSALLPTQPTPSIVPDTEFPNMTIATFGNFSSGTQGSFVLQARDIYGNNRTQPSTPGQFLIDIDTLTVTCVNTGTGTPVNGTKVLSATCVYTQTGQYVVTFTPVLKTVLPAVVKGTCGTPACATPTFNLNVASGPPYPPLDNITIGATVVAGNLLPFTLTSVDAQSNLRPMNADNGLYVVSGKLPDNSAGAAIGTVQGVSDGLYSSNFNATVKGNYTVEVKMLGQSIRNSPQYVLVTPSATDLGKSTVSGAGVNGGVALSSAYFILNAIDKWGNSNSGPNYVQDVFSSCTLNASATPCNVVSIGGAGSGIYNVSYTVPTNSPVATFTLTITDTPVGYPQTSRTFLMYSTDTNAVSWATIHKTQADNVCTVTLTAADEYPAGVESSIWLKDRNDGPPTCTPKPNPTNLPSWVLDFVTGPQPFKGSATLVTPGVYNVSFVGTKLGIYDLQVFNGGTQTEQSKAPGIKLTIVPGPLDPLSCTVVGFPVTLVAGTQGSYQVTLRDNQGNMLRNANGVNLIPKLSGTSIPNPAWTFNVIPTAGSPVVNITYVPTVATVDGGTMTIATDAQGQALPRIAGRDFVVVVTAAAVDPKFSCFYQSNSGLAPTCPVSALAAQGTAGDVYTADLYPRDVYGNVITDPATPFTVTLDSNPGMTSTASFVGNGHWKVQFTPTKVTTGGTLRAFSGATQVASATMTVNPSVLDPDHSWITGLKTNYTAGDTVAFTLNGRDRFDNMVPNAIIDISGSGPLLLKKGLGAADIKAVNSIPVTGGAYDFTYLATRASTQNLSNILPYTLAWKSSGVLVRINSSNDVVNGTNQFFVYPAVPYAPNTQLPFLTSSKIPAGSGPTLKLQLRDQYLNLVRVGGASLTTDFYAGETPTCDQGGNNITDPDVVSNFSTPYFSDSGDGTYLALINQTKAGKYYASFKVEGQPIKVCNALTTLFEITPLVADGPHSLLVGPAVDNPNSNVAGTPISFMVILRDKYDNPVIPDPTYNITVNGPATPDICPTTLNYLNRPKQNITDHENGSYSVNFEAQKAETFALVVLVNGTQVSTTCRNLTIRPWYVARFNQTSGMGTLSAAQPASVEIQGFDKFDNLVTGGKHSWSLLVTRTTEDGLDDYVFRISSAYLGSDFTKQIAPYVAHWAGAYVAVTHLQQDPDFISVAPPVADQDFNFTVLEATCAGRDPTRPKLCADRSCADTWANCPAAAGTVWCGGGTAAANAGACASRCPASQSLCRSAFNPYCAAGTCAGPVSDIVPSWATVTCANGGFPRQSAADCPTNNRVCPPGYPMCPDGHSCAASFSECNTALTACPAGMSMCYTGRCVSSASDCPTEVSCPNLSDVVCPDGSCQASADACSAPLPCYAPNDKRCSDGSCRSSFADCPSQVTCQPGFAKCQTGHCVRSVSECAAYIKKCNETMTRCADGTCRPNTLLCSSQVTCPSTMPVLCADGSCVAAVGLCRQYEMCSNATEPYMCANGLCASTMASCPTVATCTNEYSVLCSDRTCKASATGCIAKVCSVNRPFYCVDGSCGASMADCPAGAACPAGSPVRCSTGSCVPASNMCPQPVCSAGFVACANGGCATSRSECGTSMTCAWNSTRCADGSCRADCTDVTRDPSSYCKPTSSSDSFFCPSQEAGFGCAASAADCATSVTCPSDRPVRCADRSCAVSYEYCKTAPSYVPGIKTCPANTFSQDGGSCNPSTTCPLMFPVKCWDETCRKVSKDCPPETKCAQDSNDPSQVRPYLCPDGTCARNIYECIPTKQCPPGQGTVKCPLPAGGIICADSIDECPSLMNNSLGLSCPDDKQRCKNGACASTCRDADYACPHYVPIRCQNGKCVERATECPTNATAGCYPGQTRCQDGSCRQSCSGVEKPTCGQTLCTDGICRANCDGFSATGCPGGGVWCQDGSCSTEQRPCTNPGFQSQTTASNACPAWRPFRCPSGFCAMSSSLCPVPAQEKVCVSGYPVLCADGTCQRTHAQCAVIQACPGGYQRCNSSICVPATATCPPWKLCPGNQVMCWNGLCAADTASCINETTGCPGNLNKCPDGLCSSTACSDIPTGTGCASGQVKCYDGTCAAAGACSNPPGYNRADPASLPYAPTSRGSTTVWNCPVATPVRCADSTCKKYAADGSQDAETCASGVVVCPAERPHVCLDGSCVAVANHCPSFLPCASGQVRCPNDLACVGALTDCAKLTCPAGSPSLCPDGSCRRSRRECGRQMGYECEGTTPFRCFDGSCANSPAVCQQGRDCTGASMCWDGSCQKTPNYGNGDMNKYLWLHCPPVPACPGNTYGLRCWDGTCVNKTADCPATATCPSGQRCADGACRPSCPLYNGCYGSTPLYCPGAIVQCKAASDTCPIKPEVCGEDCNRDYQVQNQIVSIPAAAPVVVDVSLDSDNAPHTRLEIASGSFGTSTMLTIWGRTFATLEGYRVRYPDGSLIPKTPSQALLSSPFMCSVNSASSTSFSLNISVLASMDRRVFFTASEEENQKLKVPCDLIKEYSGLPEENGVGCLRAIAVNETWMSVKQSQTTQCSNIEYNGTISNITQVESAAGQATCVCINVTGGLNGNANPTVPKDTKVCLTILQKSALSGTGGTVFYQDSTSLGSCVDVTATSLSAVSLTPTSTTDGCASTTDARVIQVKDICLAYLDLPNTQFKCIDDYGTRISRPVWFPDSGLPASVALGRLTQCRTDRVYAIMNIPQPLPPAAANTGESWWAKYGKIVLGVGISMFILLLILAYAISRLVRYRRKYLEEKEEAEELRSEAKDLDEKHGGLGVYDDEVEMIANPLVVEMQQLQVQLDETNKMLETQKEMDERQMSQLDKERQRIKEEIDRVKAAIAAQKQKDAARVEDVPSTTPGTTTSVTSSGTKTSAGSSERQDFTGSGAPRRKHKDL